MFIRSTIGSLFILSISFLAAGCSFDSGLVGDLSCEEGEVRSDGAVCESGLWVSSGGDLDAEAPDADRPDMPDTTVGDGGCVPQSDEAFCADAGKTCGVFEGVDNCGMTRQVMCGTCTAPDVCRPDNTCSCVPEDDQQFCDRLGKDCGMVTDTDNCGMERMVDCGACEGTETCGEDAPNVCGCPCNIGGTCYPDGAPNPTNPCEACDPSVSTTDWTVDTGGSCDDGDVCTVGDMCAADGSCNGLAKDCSAEDGECRVGLCDAQTGLCFGEAQTGVACTDDGLSCTDDVCMNGSCEHTRTRGCIIDSTCYAAGTSNPMNGCEACRPGTSTTDWSPDPNGSCSDGIRCTTDVCSGGTCNSTLEATSCRIGGTCYSAGDPNPADNCEVCDPGTSQTMFVASSTCCIIDGVSYTDGTLNPTNSCEVCDSATSSTSWSNVTAGTVCCSGPPGTCANGDCVRNNGTILSCAP